MFISLSWLRMLILLLPFKMNCKVMWLSVWNVSKMITLRHAFHFMRAIATEPGLELFCICQNY